MAKPSVDIPAVLVVPSALSGRLCHTDNGADSNTLGSAIQYANADGVLFAKDEGRTTYSRELKHDFKRAGNLVSSFAKGFVYGIHFLR
jgi:hypothetical protein